ncbi:MAG: tetratricopeptide repeat protein, partial [Holophagales bacterium]|nr:tetratricopeptide repeat protein [Holophagales bacterium]
GRPPGPDTAEGRGKASGILDTSEVRDRLDDMEARLRKGFDRSVVNAYRSLAARHGHHGRALDFLAARVDAGSADPRTTAAWRIELSLAFVDKIPACGGVAAIVCKGSLAKKGLDQLDLVLSDHPDSWLALYSRGMNHLHWPRALRHSDDAAEDLEAALALHQGDRIRPYDVRAWIALGQAYAKGGRYTEAREAWRRGLEWFPDAARMRELLSLEDDEELLARVEDLRSLEAPIDTDVAFYDAPL